MVWDISSALGAVINKNEKIEIWVPETKSLTPEMAICTQGGCNIPTTVIKG